MKVEARLTDNEAVLLSYLLLYEIKTSYDLVKRLKASPLRIMSPEAGAVYPIIKKLAAKGLLTGERVAQKTRPDKTVWSVTDEGCRLFQQWAAEPVPSEKYTHSRPLFEMKLIHSMGMPSEIKLAFLVGQLEVLKTFHAETVAYCRFQPSRGEIVDRMMGNAVKILENDIDLLTDAIRLNS
jgi:DNA-binding PadR family transcriptional regulator